MSVQVVKKVNPNPFGSDEMATVPTWNEYQALQEECYKLKSSQDSKLREQSDKISREHKAQSLHVSSVIKSHDEKWAEECNRLRKWLDDGKLEETLQDLCKNHIREIDNKANSFRDQSRKDLSEIEEKLSTILALTRDNQQIHTTVNETNNIFQKKWEEINAGCNALQKKQDEATDSFNLLSQNSIIEINKVAALFSNKVHDDIAQVEKMSNEVSTKIQNYFNQLQNTIDEKIIELTAQSKVMESQIATIYEKENTIRELTTDFEQQVKQCSTFSGRLKWIFFGCK